MRIAFIFPNTKINSGCRFRVLQYLHYLKEHGIEYNLFFPRTYEMKGHKEIERSKLIIYLPFYFLRLFLSILIGNYDVIFIQRYVFNVALPIEPFFRILLGKKIIIDFDDMVYLKHPKFYSLVLRSVHKVIVGNTYLSKFARQFNSDVSVIPTPVETGQYYPVKLGENKVFTIGWIGGPSGLYLLEPLYSSFQRLAKIIDYQVVIVSDFNRGTKLSLPGVNIINRQWSEKTELTDLNNFDVGLMPLLKDDYISKGKCSYKALQYMAVGIPALIFAEGNNLEIVKDGIDGFLYETEDEFIAKVLSLYNNITFSQDMGRNALKKIENDYATSMVFKDLLNVISQ